MKNWPISMAKTIPDLASIFFMMPIIHYDIQIQLGHPKGIDVSVQSLKSYLQKV